MLVLTRAQIAKKTECIQIQGQETDNQRTTETGWRQEKLEWKLSGANEVGKIWRTPQEQVVVTEQLEQMVLSQAHGASGTTIGRHNNQTKQHVVS